MTKYITLLAALLFMLSCESDDTIDAPTQLVVEGWIDSNGFPVVILTTTAHIDEHKQSVNSLEDYVIKWAKVAINDGEQEVILTGKVDKDYFPSYIYTTSRMRGSVGKTYKLTVTYNEYHAEAETTIPQQIEVDSFRVEKLAGNSPYYGLYAYFKDNPTEKNYYKFFVYTSSSPYQSFSSSRLSLVNDEVVSENTICVPIHRDHNITEWDDYRQNFIYGEIAKVKIAQIDNVGYQFWKSYEEVATLSRNPLFPNTNSIKSNVKGALGYWLGYGASKYTIDIKEGIFIPSP